MNSIKETMKQAGLTYVKLLGYGQHVLKSWNRFNNCWDYEVWGVNKGHVGYNVIYKNTHLEFCRDYHEVEADNHKM